MPPDSGSLQSPPPKARLAHMCEGRARLVFADRKGDAAFFEAITQATRTLSPVVEVVSRPNTGSLIISFEGPPERLLAEAMGAGLFELGAEETAGALVDTVLNDAATLNLGLRMATQGRISVRDTAFLGFLAIAAVQLLRGRVDINAITALWYAAGVLTSGKAPPRDGPG